MVRRSILRIVACVALGAAALVAPATPAHAATPICKQALLTAYGPVQACTLVAASPGGRQGRAGLRSTITGAYEYHTGWLPAGSMNETIGNVFVGNITYTILAGPTLSSALGPVAFGNMYGPNRTARFGFWSTYTKQFSPISGWLPLA
jgi:hypothetical protein